MPHDLIAQDIISGNLEVFSFWNYAGIESRRFEY